VEALLRFYAELNDFLPPERRHVTFSKSFPGPRSVKDLIESLGVPHTEVDVVLANGISVDFSYRVEDGDRISVYPVFESLDVSPVVRLRPKPLREIRFVLDTHLGKLAAYLRLLGFDTLYEKAIGDEELARISAEERRILLTRDRGLLKRSAVTHGILVRETLPRRQLLEVVRRLDLSGAARPFRRCLRCNALLSGVSKDEILERLEPRTSVHYDEFRVCGTCDKIFWKGPHYQRMRLLVESVLSAAISSRSPSG
jgi:uncharacterized protein with PIN domain